MKDEIVKNKMIEITQQKENEEKKYENYFPINQILKDEIEII